MAFLKISREVIPGTRVLYMRRTGAYGAENAAMMKGFKTWLAERGLLDGSAVILGVPLDDPAVTEPENCRYDVCLTDAAGAHRASGAVGSRWLDGGAYMVFRVAHTAGAVQWAWSECFAEVGRRGGLPDPARPAMERYAERLVNSGCCELCVPIL